jgi:hypothetical protein
MLLSQFHATSAFEQTGDSAPVTKYHAVAQLFHQEQRIPFAKADPSTQAQHRWSDTSNARAQSAPYRNHDYGENVGTAYPRARRGFTRSVGH